MSNSTYPNVISKPIISTIYTADPSGVVGQDGKLYIYASHDIDPCRGCDFMDCYHVYSTEDMVHFLDEGEIMRADDVEWGRPRGGFMWAPDCGFKNGKYYYFFPHPTGDEDWGSTAQIGVAVSDKPNRGFKNIDYVRKNGVGIGGPDIIDPCIFIDDDGTNYLYYGGGVPLACVLEDDMVTVKGDIHKMEGLVDYHEAPWVFKRNGIYYMTFSNNFIPCNQLCYATSKNPLGPWDYKGVYLDNTGSGTSHGSVVEFKGRWYAFYHNSAISGGNFWLRSVCVDELFFNEDGTIRMIEQTDHACEPVGPAPAPNPRAKTYPAVNAVLEGGLEKDGNIVRGFCNANPDRSVYLMFSKVDGYEGGRATIRIKYANGGSLTRIRLIVNSFDWNLINLIPTSSDNDFSGDANFTVPLKAGHTNNIRLVAYDGDARIESITIEPLD